MQTTTRGMITAAVLGLVIGGAVYVVADKQARDLDRAIAVNGELGRTHRRMVAERLQSPRLLRFVHEEVREP